MTQQHDTRRKPAALRHAEECGNVALTARCFGISWQCLVCERPEVAFSL